MRAIMVVFLATAVQTGNMGPLDSLKLGPARRRIFVQTTSLKPGGASEQIELNENAGALELRVRRHHQDNRVESAIVPIDKRVFDEMWTLVDAEKLQTAAAPTDDRGVSDGGAYGLVLEWPDASGRAHVHALSWSNPKSPHAGIQRLFHKMAELARSRAPSVKLFYFP
jgi:hypothetical protein